jgi:hypothetical protein
VVTVISCRDCREKIASGVRAEGGDDITDVSDLPPSVRVTKRAWLLLVLQGSPIVPFVPRE